MNAPVLSTTAEFRGLLDENNRGIRLMEEEQIQNKGSISHECRDVGRPAPSKIGHVDEPTDERGEQRTQENCTREARNGSAAGAIAIDLGKHSSDDSKRRTAKDTAEEATDHQGLDIFGNSHCRVEDGKPKHTEDDGGTTAIKLGKRSPDQGTRGITSDVHGAG